MPCRKMPAKRKSREPTCQDVLARIKKHQASSRRTLEKASKALSEARRSRTVPLQELCQGAIPAGGVEASQSPIPRTMLLQMEQQLFDSTLFQLWVTGGDHARYLYPSNEDIDVSMI